jgi:hypothetical protein
VLKGKIYAEQGDKKMLDNLGIIARWCTKDQRWENCRVPDSAADILEEKGIRTELTPIVSKRR